jgi:hypothetical protein
MLLRVLKIGGIMLALALIPVAAATADRINLDFETGPAPGVPIFNDYLAAGFVSFPHDPGYQPVRVDVGNRAHSGHFVLDASVGRCIDEGYPDCEFAPGTTTGVLTRTASSVRVFAGELTQGDPPGPAQLIAFRTNGTEIDGPVVQIDTSGINKVLSVSSPAADISSFEVIAKNGDLGFDDLTLDFPNNSLPDIAPSVTPQVVPLVSGATTPVPVSIGRLNGSNGPVRVTASGLPQGVSAQPVTVPGTATTATLDLVAAQNAPSTNFGVVPTTITADPLQNASVAPAPRSTPLDVRVASPYELQLADGTGADVVLPACDPVDVPLELPRDIGLNDTIHLSVTGLPAGVSADITPSADVAPGGGLTADRTIRFTRTTAAALPADVTVQAQAPEGTRTLKLHLSTASPSATVTSGLGLTPRLLTDGTQIQVTGNGFCPGTTVRVGNVQATADATVVDANTLSFHVPALATTGNVTIVPAQGDPAYTANNTLQIDSFRNTDGFQFPNFDFDGLSLSELTDAFGSDALFVRVNPCGLWGGDCSFNSGILNPIAAIEWPIMSKALSASNGHCFGISRAVQEFLAGHRSLRSFTTGGSAFSIPAADHPQTAVGHFLDGQHALQASAEFLGAWFGRAKSVKDQLVRLQTALSHGGFPIISIQHGTEGHAVIAYNAVTNSDGTVDVYVYDSNRQFVPSEDSNASFHAGQVRGSVIHMDPNRGAWSFVMADGTTWGGGDGGTLFVAPESLIPQHPSLPGISTLYDGLKYLVFGSADGSVRSTGAPVGASYLPALDSHAIPGAAGTIITRGRSLATSFVGRKRGRYSAAAVGHGFVGSVADVITAPGVHDTLSGRDDSVSFASGMARPLTVELAQRARDATATAWSATLNDQADPDSTETAGLSTGGTLNFSHGGGPATISFTLSNVRAGSGAAKFASGPIQVGGGAHITVKPGTELRSVRVSIHDHGGRTHTVTLRNRATRPATLTLGRPRLKGTRVTARARIVGLHAPAVMGVVLRVVQHGRVTVRRVASLKHVHNGHDAFTFRLPRDLHGRAQLRTNANLITTPAAPTITAGAVTAASHAAVTVR